MNKRTIASVQLMGLLFAMACKKNDGAPPSGDQKYFPQVRTIIQSNCTISCHAPSKGFMQGLPVILETDTDIVDRAQGIKAAVADPVTPTNKRMPDGGVLSAADIETIEAWVSKGGRATD